MNSSIWILRKQMLPLSWEIGRKSMEAAAELWMGIRKGARERPEAREDLLAERRPGEGLEEEMQQMLESLAPSLCPFAFLVLCL